MDPFLQHQKEQMIALNDKYRNNLSRTVKLSTWEVIFTALQDRNSAKKALKSQKETREIN
jgi:hypothetical protein